MQDTYWKQFMMSGKIDDYLSYKNSVHGRGSEEGARHNRDRMELVAEAAVRAAGIGSGSRPDGRAVRESGMRREGIA